MCEGTAVCTDLTKRGESLFLLLDSPVYISADCNLYEVLVSDVDIIV